MRGDKKKPIKIGDIFNSWTVISEEPSTHYTKRWKIQCPHGREKIRTTRSVQTYTKDCDCQRYEIGTKINFLTVIEGTRYKKGNLEIKVKCDCGREKFISVYNFGKSKACFSGCPMVVVDQFKIGQTLGFWKVIEKSTTINNKRQTLCECKCGTKKYIRNDHLMNHMNGKFAYTRSCGCDEPNEFEVFFTSIARNAAERNIELNINVKDVENLYISQNKKCALSGVEINLDKTRKKNKIHRTASLDRIDSSKGYEIDNIQLVHKIINLMKQSYSQEEFIDWCCLVANNSKKDNKNE